MQLRSTVAAACLTAALSAGFAAAQTTWVVSTTPGPNVDFADLPPAVAAALPGDTILLRPGSYQPAVIEKGITVQGEPGVTFRDGQMVLGNLPGDETLVLRDVDLSLIPAIGVLSSRLSISNTAGTVLCQDITVATDLTNPVAITSAQRVAFTRCVIQGSRPVTMIDARVAMSDCTVQILNPTTTPVGSGTTAISLLASSLAISGGLVEASGGQTTLLTPVGAIQALGTVRIGGDAVVRAVGVPGVTGAIPAILVADAAASAQPASLLVDGRVILQPANGGAEIVDQSTTGGRVGRGRVPACRLAPGTGTPALELDGPAGEMWFQFFSPAVNPVLTEIGLVWSNPQQLTLLGMGTFDGAGEATLPLPALPPGMAPAVMVSQTLVITQTGAFVGMPTVLQL